MRDPGSAIPGEAATATWVTEQLPARTGRVAMPGVRLTRRHDLVGQLGTRTRPTTDPRPDTDEAAPVSTGTPGGVRWAIHQGRPLARDIPLAGAIPAAVVIMAAVIPAAAILTAVIRSTLTREGGMVAVAVTEGTAARISFQQSAFSTVCSQTRISGCKL